MKILTILALISINAFANQTCDEITKSKKINIQTAIEIAICNDPRLSIAYSNIKIAEADKDIAFSAYLPTISASYSGGYSVISKDLIKGLGFVLPNSNNANATGALTINHVLFDFGRTGANYDYFKKKLNQADIQKNIELQNLILVSASNWYKILSLRERLKSKQHLEKVAKDQLNLVEQMYKNSLVIKSDYLMANAKYELKKAQTTQADYNLKNELNAFKINLNIDNEAELDEEEVVLKTNDHADMGDIFEYAKQNSPILKEKQQNLDAITSYAKIANLIHVPTITLNGAIYKLNAIDTKHNSETTNGEYYTASVAVNLPLFSGGKDMATANKIREQRKLAQHQLILTQRQVQTLVFSAKNDYDLAIEMEKSSQKILESQKEAYELTQKRYAKGLLTFIDLNFTESEYSQIQEQYIRSKYAVYIAKLNLLNAIGGSLVQN